MILRRTALIALCTAATLAGCTPRTPGWHVLVRGRDGAEISVSPSRVEPLGDQVYRVWMRETLAEPLPNPQGGAYRALVARMEFDCRGRRARMLVPSLPEPDLAGWERGDYSIPGEPSLDPVAPGSRTDQELTAFCAYARRRGL